MPPMWQLRRPLASISSSRSKFGPTKSLPNRFANNSSFTAALNSWRGSAKVRSDMKSWYFAYGNNLSIDQMVHRTGAICHADGGSSIACLPTHRLIFRQLEARGPAFASILYPGEGVHGVVYRLSAADFERLDRYEHGYER